MKKLLVMIMLFLITGCAGMPKLDTMNKRMVAVEIGYDKVMDTVLFVGMECGDDIRMQ